MPLDPKVAGRARAIIIERLGHMAASRPRRRARHVPRGGFRFAHLNQAAAVLEETADCPEDMAAVIESAVREVQRRRAQGLGSLVRWV
jgi:hypothetical protein